MLTKVRALLSGARWFPTQAPWPWEPALSTSEGRVCALRGRGAAVRHGAAPPGCLKLRQARRGCLK